MRDLQRFCCSGPAPESTVMCVDKTYNLGSLHVTPTVFKHLGLFRKNNTSIHPLYLGPISIHGNSNFQTLSYFFSTQNWQAEVGSQCLEVMQKQHFVKPCTMLFQLPQGFISYFESTMKPTLNKNIKYVLNRPEVPTGWTLMLNQ